MMVAAQLCDMLGVLFFEKGVFSVVCHGCFKIV